MPIFKALELAINHMKSTDAEILSSYSVDKKGRKRPAGGNLIVDPIGDYGWTINLGSFQTREDADRVSFLQSLVEEGFSPEFIGALEHAAAQDLDAIRFDRDVDPEPGLPLFDWENGDELEESEVPAAPKP